MKYSAAVLSATLAATALAVKPTLLNSNYNLVQGQSFTLKFEGCQSGCTITLQDGPAGNLKDSKVLDSSATGGSYTFTPSDIASGTYAFKIVDNTDTDPTHANYSPQFEYKGTGTNTNTGITTGSTPAPSTTPPATLVTPTSSVSNTTTPISTTSSPTSSMPSSNSTTPMTSTTPASSMSPTKATPKATTSIPGNAGARASPLALVAGAVAVLAYLG